LSTLENLSDICDLLLSGGHFSSYSGAPHFLQSILNEIVHALEAEFFSDLLVGACDDSLSVFVDTLSASPPAFIRHALEDFFTGITGVEVLSSDLLCLFIELLHVAKHELLDLLLLAFTNLLVDALEGTFPHSREAFAAGSAFLATNAHVGDFNGSLAVELARLLVGSGLEFSDVFNDHLLRHSVGFLSSFLAFELLHNGPSSAASQITGMLLNALEVAVALFKLLLIGDHLSSAFLHGVADVFPSHLGLLLGSRRLGGAGLLLGSGRLRGAGLLLGSRRLRGACGRLLQAFDMIRD